MKKTLTIIACALCLSLAQAQHSYQSVFGDTVTMWAFIVPAGFLAAEVFKLPVMVVYFILNLDEIVKIPVVIAHYKKYKWVRNIINEEIE